MNINLGDNVDRRDDIESFHTRFLRRNWKLVALWLVLNVVFFASCGYGIYYLAVLLIREIKAE
jgi:hypothetical protein